MAKYQIRSGAYLWAAVFTTAVFVLAALSSPSAAKWQILINLRSDLLHDIQNATLGFQKIFVINLPARTDHRDAIALAASATGLDFDFVDGVTDVLLKVVPGEGATKLKPGELGNWRAHMNIAQRMVDENIASALVLEDDVDWDVRIKDQMQDFAKASRLLLQPRHGTKDEFLDPSQPQPRPDEVPVNLYMNQSTVSKPTTSPYADLHRWDLLWIGHCGTFFPTAAKTPNRPIGRAVILDDETVPEPQHIGTMIGNDDLEMQYPPHSRVVSRASQSTCTFGYGLSLPGARRLLYEFGIRDMHEATDMALRSFCDGDNRILGTCLTVRRELLGQHRPAGSKAAFSEIESFDGEPENSVAFTRNIRWSVRMNLQKMLNGDKEFMDQYKDGEAAVDQGWGHG